MARSSRCARWTAVALAGVPLAACAVTVPGTPTAAPLPTINTAALIKDVRAVLAGDPRTASIAQTVDVTCPRDVPADPYITLFCQVVSPSGVLVVPVTVLDREGDYRVDRPY